MKVPTEWQNSQYHALLELSKLVTVNLPPLLSDLVAQKIAPLWGLVDMNSGGRTKANGNSFAYVEDTIAELTSEVRRVRTEAE